VIRALVLAGVLLVILLVTVRPWYGFVGHSHWQLVEWVPFSAGVRPFDIIANVMLFVPFGAALAWRRGGRAVLFATVAGALLSLSVELYQVYCHGHFPTMTDVLTNTSGTLLGAALGAWGFRNRI
jgi:glycopeptide antibiotics resistance protein